MARQTQKEEKPDSLSWKEKTQALRYIPPFLRMIWKTSPSMVLANLICRLFKSVLPALILYVGKLIIDEAILQYNLTEKDLDYIYMLVAAELLLVVLSEYLARQISLLDSLVGDLFSNASSVRIMQHAALLDLSQFEDAAFYDKMERARRQTVGRSVLLSQLLSQLQDIVTIFFLGVGLVFLIPWLIPILLISVIPSFLGETHFNAKSYSLTRNWTPKRRELDYLRYIGASNETAKEIKIFGLSDFITNRFSEVADKYYEENKKLAINRFRWGIALSFIGTAGYYGAYVIILMQTVNGSITIGDLAFLSGSFSKMKSTMEGILSKFSSMAESALYLQDFFDFFKIEPKIFSPEQSIPFPSPILEGFVFENVGFKYDNAESWALRNLNLTLHKGEKLALVGENGSGKTTLTKLLARLYDPTEGRILLDGIDLKLYDPANLRKSIGVIFQDFVRFQMLSSDNIAVGKIDEKNNPEAIIEAAQLSLADEVIESLPKKYEQMIGRRFDDGVDLSGGQWQKIALGRAYMRDAQVIILDEPTAALDARAEHEVFLRFSELTKGKTSVLISHRFSTVRMADRILVLHEGQLEESGSHEELLENNGKYAELFKLQARGYL